MNSIRKMATRDIREKYIDLKHKHETYLRIVNDFIDLMPDGMLKSPHSALKSQLSRSSRDAILSYMNQPSARLWQDICTIMIRPGKNLFEAWAETDKSVIESMSHIEKEPIAPHPDDLRAAIVNQMESEYQRCQDALAATKGKLKQIEDDYFIPSEVKARVNLSHSFSDGSVHPR